MKTQTRERSLAILKDVGPLFMSLFAVYLIFILKVATVPSIADHWFFGFYSILITTYILSRFLLSYFHVVPDADPSYRPTITFVVPAKNEEDNIRETMRKFSEVDYPPELIEVIAINDGSTDRTLEEMRRAASEIRSHIARVEVIHWDTNRGKRHGMAEGVLRARHDIVIFIDSDSLGTAASIYVAAKRPVVAMILKNPPPLRSLVFQRHGWWNLWLLATPVALQIPAELNAPTMGPYVNIPACFLLSDHDEVVPPRYHDMVVKAYAGPTLVIDLPYAGHNSPVDAQSEKKVQAWLEQQWSRVFPATQPVR